MAHHPKPEIFSTMHYPWHHSVQCILLDTNQKSQITSMVLNLSGWISHSGKYNEQIVQECIDWWVQNEPFCLSDCCNPTVQPRCWWPIHHDIQTGHRSIDEVCTYMSVLESQQQALSSILKRDAMIPPPQKKWKVTKGQENQAANPPVTSQNSLDVAVPKSGGGNSAVSFSGCQNITVNYYCERK